MFEWMAQVPAVLLDMEAVDAASAPGASAEAQQASSVLAHSPHMEVQIRTQGGLGLTSRASVPLASGLQTLLDSGLKAARPTKACGCAARHGR